MRFETERLILRPWELSDADNLYEYAKDERVGPIAGWPAHTSVEHSKEIIKTVLGLPETYAVCLKEDNKAIGSIGLMVGDQSNLPIGPDEAEMGYWIGVPFWGKGLIPEAVRCLMKYGFEVLGMNKLWCGYFDGNTKSKRVQEKCGFQHHRTLKDKEWPLLNDLRTQHITCLTKEQWLEGE
jgi:RimJ/RimL family protein N-acetyltransferase